VVAVLLVSTAAEILPNNNLLGVGEVRFNLARLLILAGLAAVLVAEGPRLELFRARLGLPLLLLLAVALVSSHKWGTYPPYRFLVEGIALFYLTFAAVRTRPDAREALALLALVAAAIAAFTAVAQVSQGAHTGFYRSGCTPVTLSPGASPPSGSITRALGPFDNPNVLGGYLLLVLPLGALCATLLARARGVLVPLVVAMALGYLALVFTFSRAAVLIGIAAVGVGLWIAGIRRRLPYALVALGLAGAVIFAAGHCGSEATSGFGRSQEWRETLQIIRDNPVWGVGLGRLGDVLHARNSLSTARHAHNLFLTWWAEAGTGALIPWIWIALALLWRSLRGALAGDGVARAAFVSLLGFFAFSLTDHPANVQQVALAFWIVAGLAAATGVPGWPRAFRRREAARVR
jgi:O-antigen ligase